MKTDGFSPLPLCYECQAEAVCELAPYLPCNRADAQHHLEAGTTQRHIDTHFRLLREDLVAPVRASLTPLLKNGAKELLQTLRAGQNPRLAGGNARLPVYRNAKVASIDCDKRLGLVFMIEFDQLSFQRQKSREDLKAFWDRTRRLQHGCLVSLLVTPSDGEVYLVSGTIAKRDTKDLADAKRPRVFLHSESMHKLIELRTSPPSSEVILLQISDE